MLLAAAEIALASGNTISSCISICFHRFLLKPGPPPAVVAHGHPWEDSDDGDTRQHFNRNEHDFSRHYHASHGHHRNSDEHYHASHGHHRNSDEHYHSSDGYH